MGWSAVGGVDEVKFFSSTEYGSIVLCTVRVYGIG